jgi:hypothetical protein
MPPNGIDMDAAITVAASEIIMESAAICITSGSRESIKLIACKNPDTISLIEITITIVLINGFLSKDQF